MNGPYRSNTQEVSLPAEIPQDVLEWLSKGSNQNRYLKITADTRQERMWNIQTEHNEYVSQFYWYVTIGIRIDDKTTLDGYAVGKGNSVTILNSAIIEALQNFREKVK